MKRFVVLFALLFASRVSAQQTCDSSTVADVRSQTDRARAIHQGSGSHNTNTRARLKSIDSILARVCLPPVTPPPPPPPVNQAPNAMFVWSCAYNGTSFTCSLNGNASSDPDGAIVSYAWTSATLGAQTGQAVTFTNVPAGSHVVTLTVTDNQGATATATLTVTTPNVPPPPPPGTAPSVAPALPARLVNVQVPTPTRTVNVPATANLQTYLDQAQRGDELVLPAGAVYTGNFTLPARAGTCAQGWLTLRTANVAALPAFGSRIDPAVHASAMPKIVSNNVLTTMKTATSASCWYLLGIELSVTSTVSVGPTAPRHQGILYLGDYAPNDTLQQGSDFVLDRSYVHALPNTNEHRCVLIAGARVAIIGSQLLECHGKGFDAQAVAMWRGPGPYRFENNRMEASGEVILSGGDIAPVNVVPSDIVVRRNILTRPMTWKGVWTVKNIFELKNAKRVLVEENIMENNWVDAQAGSSIMLGTLDNPCTWCIVADVTFRWNQISNVASAFNLVDHYGNAQLMTRVQITDNLVTNVGSSTLGMAQPRCFYLQAAIHDLWIERNTCGAPYGFVAILTPTKQRFTFRSNAATSNSSYPWWSDQGQGSASLSATLSTYLISGNAFVASADAQVPLTCTLPNVCVGNTRVASPGAIPAGVGVDQAALQARLVGVR